MKSAPLQIRLDDEIVETLEQGVKRTSHDRLKLIRLTLHRYLGDVIQEEAQGSVRLTCVDPWPKGALARAYKRAGKEWDKTEAAAVTAPIARRIFTRRSWTKQTASTGRRCASATSFMP